MSYSHNHRKKVIRQLKRKFPDSLYSVRSVPKWKQEYEKLYPKKDAD